MFSIDPDAHSTDEIDNVAWGVMMARKGAVPKDRVLNTLSLDEFAAHLEQRKHDTHKAALEAVPQSRIEDVKITDLP